MTHTDLLRKALDALELQEPTGCPREHEHWRRTASPVMTEIRAALAQPAPAAMSIQECQAALDFAVKYRFSNGGEGLGAHPAPAQPAVREPLTDLEMTAIYRRVFGLVDSRPVGPQVDFIRAIERAHGITGDGK